MQAGAEGASPKRGRAGQAIVVSREARATVMKAATAALNILVVEEAVAVEVGLVVQAALMRTDSCPLVVGDLGTLAAA